MSTTVVAEKPKLPGYLGTMLLQIPVFSDVDYDDSDAAIPDIVIVKKSAGLFVRVGATSVELIQIGEVP